jgi:hypothetical protein
MFFVFSSANLATVMLGMCETVAAISAGKGTQT